MGGPCVCKSIHVVDSYHALMSSISISKLQYFLFAIELN